MKPWTSIYNCSKLKITQTLCERFTFLYSLEPATILLQTSQIYIVKIDVEHKKSDTARAKLEF